MTAPVIALTAGEAEAIARANAALAWIKADTFPWPILGGGEIHRHADSLRESLDDHAGLTAGRIHPADLFPELGRGQDNAMETALRLVTQDIRAWTEALTGLANAAEEAAIARGEERAA